ncbi:MAG: ABC transporter permease [Candidatus Obscuribacterales bacterium]|nr:ABC transporter permease [Candidatus Obscuribacterales bacterium]
MATLEQDKALSTDGVMPDVAMLDAFQPDELGLPSATIIAGKKAAPVSFPRYVFSKVNELRFIKFAFVSFVTNNLRRRYQRSVLGFAWSMLNPLLMMVVLTTIFSLLFHRDPKTYGMYMFTGLLPWQFISESIAIGCMSITNAEAFMKKVYVPKLFFPLVTCSTECVNFVLALTSMILLAMCVGLKPTFALLVLPAAIAVTFLFTFGITLCLSVGTVYFRDLTHIVKVVLQSFFYFIPIIWPLNALPEKYAHIFLSNPFTHFILLYRSLIFDGQLPPAQEWGWCIMYATLTLTAGFWVLQKKEKDIIFRL